MKLTPTFLVVTLCAGAASAFGLPSSPAKTIATKLAAPALIPRGGALQRQQPASSQLVQAVDINGRPIATVSSTFRI